MKKLFILMLPVLVIACKKERFHTPSSPAHPQMHYTNLGNVSVKFGQQKAINLDADNTVDLLFSTVLVGDPVLKRDRKQYYVNAGFDVFLLTNDLEQTPVLNKGEAITVNDPAGYNWFNASSVVLAEKIIEETGPDYWEGNWKNADHKYIPVQVRRNGLRYTGWVEASFNTVSEELILHKTVIAVESGKDIKAGL